MPLSAAFPLLCLDISLAFDNHISATSKPSAANGAESDSALETLATELTDAIDLYLRQGLIMTATVVKPGSRDIDPPALKGKNAVPILGTGVGVVVNTPKPKLKEGLFEILKTKRDAGSEAGANPDLILAQFASDFSIHLHEYVRGSETRTAIVNMPWVSTPIISPSAPCTPAFFPPGEPGVGSSLKVGQVPTGILTMGKEAPLMAATLTAFQNQTDASGLDGASSALVNATLGAELGLAIHTFLFLAPVHHDTMYTGFPSIPGTSIRTVPPPGPCLPLPMVKNFGDLVPMSGDGGSGIGAIM